MVFRFSEEEDKELMREVILQKLYAAKYGDAGRVWVAVAERVSLAIKTDVVDKQVRDRVRLLNKNWKAGEFRSSLGSGIGESKDASDVQSHYDSLAGLVAEYAGLEDSFKAEKNQKKDDKKAEEASANVCASQIVAEAVTRGALRGTTLSSSESSAGSDDDSASVTSTPSVVSSATATKSVTGSRRNSVFQSEIDRQEKRIRTDMEMRPDQFDQQLQMQQHHHAQRLSFEREQHESQLSFERERELAREHAEKLLNRAREEAEERNRQLILQCVTILGKTLSRDEDK